MRLLRYLRKHNYKLKIPTKRILILISTLIMTTFAWFAFSKTLQTGIGMHIRTWNIEVFDSSGNKVDGNNLTVNFTDLYPTMENQSQNFTVKNNGEVDASISFEIAGLTILGVEYQIVDTKPDDNSTTYIIKNAEKESTTDTSKMCGDIINDTERFPFVLSVERDKKIEKNGGTGTITATFKWDGTDDTKHELDSIWGYNMANYYENNTDKAGIQLRLKLKTEQIEE